MKRSKHNLSHYKLMSADMGKLYPIGVMEVLPGDTIQHSTSALVRVAPLLAPVMHPVHCYIRHFFVPSRILWDGFEDFITGGPDGRNNDLPPVINTATQRGSLADYFGLPVTQSNALPVSALPFRAYAMIWNEFFRDQDLQGEIMVNTGSGNDTTTNTALQSVNWEKDYFTAARPWQQKGPAISIPLGTTAPVTSTGVTPTMGRPADAAGQIRWQSGTSDLGLSPAPGGAGNIVFKDPTGLQADLSSATAITVQVLREAMALQRYEEARSRFGSRYTEYLRYLGVRSSDARLQHPEYLGGGRSVVQFSEVLQTAEGTDPVGDLKGHGIASMRSNRYRRFFEEHGHVISLMYVRPKTMYMDGVDKMWSRKTKEDYYQRELAHIGQDEVLNKEIYADHPQPDGVFGYQDRYDEYRRMSNTVAGEFRDTTLNYWHMARKLTAAPALNSAFITCNPTDRIFASSNTDTLYIMARHSIQARRMITRSGESKIY
ncbi:MAG: major capsid protein [Arizlama microvirus]|nr:MAG: major capsid protein [Arizlama microvirus]